VTDVSKERNRVDNKKPPQKTLKEKRKDKKDKKSQKNIFSI
jgi:hypothetical protein